ncbi:MAG: cupin domain-containing protein, partial [Actinobacteria bacterium]|nr:cupin domain-containing protein [Actinomycetota bacterium]
RRRRAGRLSSLASHGSAVPGRTGGLARCVGDPDRFLAAGWSKRARLHRGTDVRGLLGVDEVDHIVSSTALRAPAFRLVKGGVTLEPGVCTRRARIGSRTVTDLIDVGRVWDHFADGATIVLQGLHRYWPPVAELCRDLEEDLTHPVQANAYVTPPVAQGLRVHADRHDVFALQTHGSKQWVVYEDDRQPRPDGSGETPSLDARLQPGDCLYIPQGVRHAARTVDRASIHLTLGVRTVTWADVLAPVWRRAVEDPPLQQPLPAGFARDPEALAQEAGRRLKGVAEGLAAADAGEAVARAAREVSVARAPALGGQLHQLLFAGEIGDGTVVRRRPHSACAISRHGDALQVELGDRTLRMPVSAEPALRAGLRRGEFAVADLADHLDEPGRVTLVRRLVREGLLMVVDG